MPDLPLNALRAFEVAARSGSFVQAGRELGVTAAAVSQQVRALEAAYGKQLFLRQGNRITLSDSGRAIYPRLEAALAEIAAIGAELGEGQARARLVLSCLPTLAEAWLLPRLGGRAGGLEIRVQDDPVNLAAEGVDLRLSYGAHFYPDHQIEPLFRDRLVAVSAPGLAPEGLAALPDAAFIHTDWGPRYASGPSWAAYWRLDGRRRPPDIRAGLVLGQTHAAMIAAGAGLGAALVPERLAGAMIRSGQLVRHGVVSMPLPWDYVMVWPLALARRRALQDLIAHLRAAAALAA